MRKSRLVIAALGAATIAAAILPTAASAAITPAAALAPGAAHPTVVLRVGAPASSGVAPVLGAQPSIRQASDTLRGRTARDSRATQDQRNRLRQQNRLRPLDRLSQRDRMLLRRNVTPRDIADLRRNLSARDVANLRRQLAAGNHTLPGQYHFAGILRPVPTNHVRGIGFARIWTQGRYAHVSVLVFGLQRNSPHAMSIHVNGVGQCPGPGRATRHNGHRTISATDGARSYGAVGTALTTRGDASPRSALALARFPRNGNFLYSRTIRLTNSVRNNLIRHRAVIVVHGISYNRNNRYDRVLGASELDPSLPREATAPALCGALH